MSLKESNKRFSKTPDLSAILNSDNAKAFIKSGEATDNVQEKIEVKPEENATPVPVEAEAKFSKKGKSQKQAATDDMTWMTTNASLRVQHIVRVPAPLKLLIEYLGDTGKGMNQTSISVEGLTHIAEKLAKERGLPLPDSWGSWLDK